MQIPFTEDIQPSARILDEVAVIEAEEEYGGYTDLAWNIETRFDVPTILREVLEMYLARNRQYGWRWEG